MTAGLSEADNVNGTLLTLEKSLAGEFQPGVIPIIQMGLLLSIVFYGVVTFLQSYYNQQVCLPSSYF